MLSSLESGLGLDIVLWLQAHTPPPLAVLAQVLHFAGGTIVYVGLLILILWAVDHGLGVRLLITLAGSVTLTEGLKALLARPRPFQAFPDLVTPLVPQSGYGLPSGHTMQALAVLGCLAWSIRDRRLTLLVTLYVIVMGWARMALGVHYPQDVFVAVLVGGLWLWAVIRFGDRVAAGWNRLPILAQAGLVVLAGVGIYLALWEADNGLALAGMLIGGGLGLIWEMRRVRFSAVGSFMQRGLRVVVGLGLILVVALGLKVLFAPLAHPALWDGLRYILIGLAGLALWPWICVRVGLAGQRAAV